MTDKSRRGRLSRSGRPVEPDYCVFANIEDQVRRVERIPCDLLLPTTPGDAVYARLYPSGEQMKQLYPLEGGIEAKRSLFEFRLEAEISRVSGERLTITGPIAYAGQPRSVWRGREEKEHTIEAEIVELVVKSFRPSNSVATSAEVEGFFRIAGSGGLIPPSVICKGWLEYKIEPFGQVIARLASGTEVTFDRMLAYQEAEVGLFLTEGLTAHFAFEGNLTTLDRVETARKELDDYLLVSSFGGRDFGRCVGWQADDSERSVKMFIAVMMAGLGRPTSDPLILHNFGNFCQEAYNSFSRAPNRKLLRQALLHIAPKDVYISEYSLVRLFSALETLVLYHRRNANSEFILQKSEFGELRKFLSEKIDKYEPLSEQEGRRGLIKDKLSELNRISFARAFEALCAYYGVDVSDLWPVYGSPADWPLSELRNKIVHGDLVRGIEERAIVTAEWHLRWTVERILLAIFGWSLKGTRASAEYLLEKGDLLYRDWEADRITLRETNRS